MGSISCCSFGGGAGVADFEKIQSCTANGIIPVDKYVSKSSGLTVVHADIPGPIVSGYICVATRAQDDDGLPHALEHLVFLGSENYPHAGVLDKLSTKCLVSGTNAWTDVDHTCFTLNTAGNDGFCQLLPIFLDHILYPLLTEAAFKTEVYHVGGRGNDAGVLYSVVTALENTAYSKAYEVLFKELYPLNSGYHWNAGGTSLNIRETCSNDKVRAFHKRFYHPRNICVIICGQVDLNHIFRSLYLVLGRGTNDNDTDTASRSKVVKPWLSEEKKYIPNKSSPVDKTVGFPSMDDESGCLVTVGFLGPSVISADLKETFALVVLFKYLVKTADAPLQQAFIIERPAGYLATSLDFNVVEYSRTAFIFEFDGVPLEYKENIVKQLREVLEAQLHSFDMGKMSDTIKSIIQTELRNMENAPHSTVAEAAIRDFLYGDDKYAQFEKRMNQIAMLEALIQETDSFWLELLRDQILSSNWVTVYAEPSRQLMQEFSSYENGRVLHRKEVLGESGLSEVMHELDNAILEKCRPVPKKVLKSVKVSSMNSIQYHKINRMKNPAWVPVTDFPAILCLDDISTNFVFVCVFMDTSTLEAKYRRFLPLFKEVLLTSPILGSSNATKSHYDLIPYEEVCASRERDLQLCELDIGLEVDVQGEVSSRFSCGSYSHILALSMKMETDKVEQGMLWIKKILWGTRWTMDRIKVALNRLIGKAYQMKGDGSRLCQAILRHLIYKETSNVVNCGLLAQFKLFQDLETGDDEKFREKEMLITTAFDSILKVITDPRNVSLHMATNVQKLRNKLDKLPCENLGNLLKLCFPFQDTLQIEGRDFAKFPDTDWMIPMKQMDGSNPKKNQIIFGLLTDNFSYLAMIAPGPTSFLDSDLPPLLTTIQYFTQHEGPLYQQIRAEGHCGTFDVVTKVNEGLIYFHLYHCVDLVAVYSACLAVITNHLGKSARLWSENLLNLAKNSLILDCLETEKTPLSLAANSCLDYYRNVPGTYMRDLIVKLAKVKMKDVRKMTKKYLDILFHSPRNNYATVVVCPVENAECIQKGLEARGKPMSILRSLDDL